LGPDGTGCIPGLPHFSDARSQKSVEPHAKQRSTIGGGPRDSGSGVPAGRAGQRSPAVGRHPEGDASITVLDAEGNTTWSAP
jgi:hypothetical protein